MHKLFFIFLMFANSEILANKVILQEINDTNKNEYELSFKLDKVALIKSESFDDEPKIILKIEGAREFKQIAQNQSKLIKSFSSSVEDDGISIIIELDQLVKWTKPTQEKMTDHVKMSMNLIPDKKLDKNIRDIVIVIDAGHGGKDPGAVGKNILEKDITLMIAKELARTLQNTEGFSPKLIRSKDEFIELDERYMRARRMGADIFVSIHADGFTLSRVKGASVYIWSKTSSSMTADNLSDQKLLNVKNTNFDKLDFNEDLNRPYFLEEYDLTNKKSLLLADKILEELKRDPYTYIHKPNVEFANFRVLKLIDVPSVLVESGFISNPDDAKRLSGKPGRRMIARGIFKGILNYLKQENPKNTIMQDKPKSLTYIIQKGDLLSEIAIRFGVTVDELISQNKINPKRIYPGQKIKINI